MHASKPTKQQKQKKITTRVKTTKKSTLTKPKSRTITTKKVKNGSSPTVITTQRRRVAAPAAGTMKVNSIAPNDQHRFEGKLVLITGGGAGIGRATALQLAKEKANLSLVDLNMAGLEETRKLCLEVNPNSKIEIFKADCSKDEEVEDYVNKTVKAFGRIDGAFINHGVEGPQHPCHLYNAKDFSRVIDINLNGVMHNMRHVIKFMTENQGFGSIVNCSSVAGLRAVPNMSAYVGSKHGVVGLTKAAAIEYGQFLNVNCVNPGAIGTDMMRNALTEMAKNQGQTYEQTEKAFAALNPAKKIGSVENVAYTVAFLLSHQAALLNGVAVNLDHGQINQY